MAPEVRWQASSAAARSGSDIPASDQDTVESLLRRLIRRIEESERRYAEALDELQARLGHVSYSAAVTEVIGTPEETETLERLRLQLSALARRLEQPPEPPAEIERLSPLDKAWRRLTRCRPVLPWPSRIGSRRRDRRRAPQQRNLSLPSVPLSRRA